MAEYSYRPCDFRRRCTTGCTLLGLGEPGAHHQPLGAVVPDFHLHDLAVADDVAIDVTVALERRAVQPFAVERARLIDGGLGFGAALDHVSRAEFLLHPLVARL